MRQICIKISERAPEFGVGTLLPELLQDTSNWDILLIGLRSLIAILLDAPSLHKASQASSNDEVHRLTPPCTPKQSYNSWHSYVVHLGLVRGMPCCLYVRLIRLVELGLNKKQQQKSHSQ